MAVDLLTSVLAVFGLKDSETLLDEPAMLQLKSELPQQDYLLFNPRGKHAKLQTSFDRVPRYLFRVSTPISDGSTNKAWVNSKDAALLGCLGTVDIFSRSDADAAAMLWRHLNWKGTPDDQDNLVSWTSSLLFAVRYIIFRNLCPWQRSNLKEIKLSVVDTTKFPKGTFLRDLDLMDSFATSDDRVKKLKHLRTQKNENGTYYFGEYLSQGALKVKNKCQMVSATSLITDDLFLLLPELRESMQHRDLLAKEVLRLRGIFYKQAGVPKPTSKVERRAAFVLGSRFGENWTLPMMAGFLALRPRCNGDVSILKAFRDFRKLDRAQCSPALTQVAPSEALPDVQQFKDIMQSIYTDYRLEEIRGELKKYHIWEQDVQALLQINRTRLVHLENSVDASQLQASIDAGFATTRNQLQGLVKTLQRLDHSLAGVAITQQASLA